MHFFRAVLTILADTPEGDPQCVTSLYTPLPFSVGGTCDLLLIGTIWKR